MATRNQSPQAVLGNRPVWLILGWLLVLFVIYLSLTPEPMQVPGEQGDKFGHMFAYAALMSWFANLYELPARRLQFAVGFVALGVALEFVQRWTGYRAFEVADMAADAVGVAVGWLLAPPRMPNYLRGAESIFAAFKKGRSRPH
jgi:VanZ family protein